MTLLQEPVVAGEPGRVLLSSTAHVVIDGTIAWPPG